MSRKSSTMSSLARESGAESSQQPTLPLPVQNGAHASNNVEKIVPSRESKIPSFIDPRWRCPPEIILNPYWRVAAGEESEEVKVQEERIARLKEFRYFHPSAIPPSPPVSPDREEGEIDDDDENIPVIPLEPVYDSFSDEEAPFSTYGVSNSMASASEPVAELAGSYADVGAAASAAFTALMRTYEQGNLIDTELLIRLLNEPKMIELLKNVKPLANSGPTQPPLNTPLRVTRNPVQENLIDTELLVKLLKDPKMIEALNNTGLLAIPGSSQPSAYPQRPISSLSVPLPHSMHLESFPALSTTIFARPPSTYPPMPIPTYPVSVPAESFSSVNVPPPVKDISYLKSLIRQHGVERPEFEGPRSTLNTSSYPPIIIEPQYPLRLPEGQGKKNPLAYTKPCMYFGTPRGCRLGLSCPFRHEFPHQQQFYGGVSGASGSKRVKLTRDPGNGH